jgi:hypothetical protein
MAEEADRTARATAVAKHARGMHAVARQTDQSYQQSPSRVVGRGTQPDHVMDQIVGQATAVAILDALALELMLKARLYLADRPVKNTHDHGKLFADLPNNEKADLEKKYASQRHSSMASTLQEALSRSGAVFVEWRYMYEHPQVTAHNTEMEVAFDVLKV